MQQKTNYPDHARLAAIAAVVAYVPDSHLAKVRKILAPISFSRHGRFVHVRDGASTAQFRRDETMPALGWACVGWGENQRQLATEFEPDVPCVTVTDLSTDEVFEIGL